MSDYLELAAELVRLKPDVIVTGSTTIAAVKYARSCRSLRELGYVLGESIIFPALLCFQRSYAFWAPGP